KPTQLDEVLLLFGVVPVRD
ncbi:unnamed protein product, partial [Allacma fusca]